MNDKTAVHYGIKSENYFLSKLNSLGIPAERVNSFYDFKINGHFVEVKSCQLTVVSKSGKRKVFIPGRFDFTNEFNRELQYSYDAWIVFILRGLEDFMILGVCKARSLNKKRYVSLNHLRKLNLWGFSQWINEINK